MKGNALPKSATTMSPARVQTQSIHFRVKRTNHEATAAPEKCIAVLKT